MPFGLPGIGTAGGSVLPGIGIGPKAGGSTAARLVSRLRIFDVASYTDTVPAGAKWVRVGCNGRGGYNGGSGTGAGAAYSYDDGAVSGGQSVSVAMATSTATTNTNVTVGGLTVSAASASGTSQGLAANCTGSLKRSGGAVGSDGEFGGKGVAGSSGGCGGDSDVADGLGLLGNGSNGPTSTAPGPGGGANSARMGVAAAVIEFWTSNPRAA